MNARVAGAPVSWGVIEVPDWGYQMPADRLLREAASLGLPAVEAGPEDLLPRDPDGVFEMLTGYGLSLVGGFVPAVLHEPQVRDRELAFVERRAKFLAAAGADVVVLAASAGSAGYEEVFDPTRAREALFESIGRFGRSAHHGSRSVHQHYGRYRAGRPGPPSGGELWASLYTGQPCDRRQRARRDCESWETGSTTSPKEVYAEVG